MTAEASQTLHRGVRLLEVLAGGDGDSRFSVTELARRLGVSRPAVYRLVATLEAHGLVTRAADGEVRLGLGLLALARSVTPVLQRAALPRLRQLAEETGATAHLTVAEIGSDEAVAVAVVEPSHTDLHVAYRVGSRHALDRGAAGRAILAARQGDGAGFVVTEGELQPGAVGIAAAIVGVAGLEASVGLVAIGDTLDPARAGPEVVAAAAAIAAALR
jgi:DNA-binding IclR family transcriptional regulator